MKGNNVTRLLEAHKARFSVFELPAEKLGAIETADYLAVNVQIVYKSIILTSTKGKPVLCLIPGDRVVDLKKVAALVGEKKVAVTSLQEAEKLTGLQVGGISPLALIHKGFKFLIDSSIKDHQDIHISGGQRGLNLRINTTDLIEILHPQIADISKPALTESDPD